MVMALITTTNTGLTRPYCFPIFSFPFILLLLLLFYYVVASDTESLLKFKESLQNANALSSWNNASSSSAPPPCTDGHANWQGVVCYRGHVWGLQLEKMGLKGAIDVDSLKDLPYLRTISLMHNDFDTEWPQLNKLMGLKTIYLSNNKFSGDVPPQAFQGMQWLKRLHLSNNHFTGPIPSSLASLPRLMDLRLDGNKFTGPIPQFGETTITSFSVANNRLEGEIPAGLSRIPASSFSGNEGLCGAPLGACSSKHNKSIDASAVVAVVLVSVAVLVIAAVILLLLVRRRRRKQEQAEQEGVVVSRDHHNNHNHNNKKKGSDEEVSDHSHDRNNNTDNRSTTRSQGSSSASSQSSSKNKGGDNSNNMRLSFVREDADRQFDLQELLRASAEVLGSGCYSSSYKAALLSGPTVVVKRFRQMNNVGRGEFQEQMRRLGRLTHPNLLPLLAYYYRKEEKLLVTDFVHNGSLAVRLHGHEAIGQPSLDWASRLKIVKGIARGVEYLYREMPSLIAPHGHLKSSNVLLTESLEPVLNDYGLVPMINQDVAPDIMVIYKSPEYLQNGRITKKTDVWGLGILILEILTGKFPAILQQGRSDHHEYSLATWVESVVPDAEDQYWRSSEVFDREMEIPKNSEGEMVKLLKVALACCEADVERRWDLKEAVDRIQEVREQRDIGTADQDDFYSSYASEEADTRPSSRALSSEEEVS